MPTLLAACELFMIQTPRAAFWDQPTQLAEQLSARCLKRMLKVALYTTVSQRFCEMTVRTYLDWHDRGDTSDESED